MKQLVVFLVGLGAAVACVMAGYDVGDPVNFPISEQRVYWDGAIVVVGFIVAFAALLFLTDDSAADVD